MTDRSWLAGQFEPSRAHLTSVAYSMLGSVSEAEDAVQECWVYGWTAATPPLSTTCGHG
jgi:RNA polymerase sigma-70 factor, ECF subfamily